MMDIGFEVASVEDVMEDLRVRHQKQIREQEFKVKQTREILLAAGQALHDAGVPMVEKDVIVYAPSSVNTGDVVTSDKVVTGSLIPFPFIAGRRHELFITEDEIYGHSNEYNLFMVPMNDEAILRFRSLAVEMETMGDGERDNPAVFRESISRALSLQIHEYAVDQFKKELAETVNS